MAINIEIVIIHMEYDQFNAIPKKNNYKGLLSTANPISNIAYYTISKSFLKLCHVNY